MSSAPRNTTKLVVPEIRAKVGGRDDPELHGADELAGPPSIVKKGSVLPCAVRFEVFDGAELKGNKQLASLVVSPGVANREIESIRRNLVEGEALPQTVVLAKRVDSGDLLGFTNVRLHEEFRESVPPWLSGLRCHQYVGVLVRDARYEKCQLADKETWLGQALVRAAIEVVTPVGEAPPKMWVMMASSNTKSRRAFEHFNFELHPRSREIGGDVCVRWAGVDLDPPPEISVYVSPLRPGPVLVPPTALAVGRNDPCWCGSGKKYKKCCGF